MPRWLAFVVVGIVICGLGAVASGQRRNLFIARLSSMPVDIVSARTTTGRGSVTATLLGGTLTIEGHFEGMNSPATTAHLRRAPKGLRGPAIADLVVTHGTSGTIAGTIRLAPSDLVYLESDSYYVQLQSVLNAEGHLRGWLLK